MVIFHSYVAVYQRVSALSLTRLQDAELPESSSQIPTPWEFNSRRNSWFTMIYTKKRDDFPQPEGNHT